MNRQSLLIFTTIVLMLVFALPVHATASSRPLQAYDPISISAEAAAEDIDILEDVLLNIHPGTFRYASEETIAEQFELLRASIEDGTTDVDLYREISALLGNVRCEHTYASYGSTLSNHRQFQDSFFPFRFQIFGGQMYVVSVDRNLESLQAGDQIMAIDGIVIDEILETLRPMVAVDGYTDSTRDAKLASDGDLNTASAFEQYYSLFYGFPDEFTITFNRDGGEQETVVEAISGREWQRLDWVRDARIDFVDSVFYEILDNDIAVLRVDTFVNYRDFVHPQDLLGPIFAEINAAGVERLILDLRNTGGGSDDAAIGLLTFLKDEAFTPMRSIQARTLDFGDARPYMNTWDWSVLNDSDYELLDTGWYELIPSNTVLSLMTFEPHPDRFRGDITILTSPINASGTTNLLAQLDGQSNVTMIGEATGGNVEGPTAGVIFFLELPNSEISVNIPLWQQYNNVEVPQTGMGITPDIEVIPTAADYFNGIDTVLDVALNR